MSELSRAARGYITAVLVSAISLWLLALNQGVENSPGLSSYPMLELLPLWILCVSAEFMEIPLPRGGFLSVSSIPMTAIALLYPAYISIPMTAAAMLTQQILTRKPWYKAGFNASTTALGIGMTSIIAASGFGNPRHILDSSSVDSLLRLSIAALAFFIINKFLTHIIVALARRRSLRSVVIGNSQGTSLPELGMVAIGELFAVIWLDRPYWSFTAIIATAVFYRTFSYMNRLQTETEEAVVALADAVDSRDPATFQHSKRVARYSEALGEELALDPSDVEQIVLAARVHDVGKIGVPDSILLKPGKLTDDEWRKMRDHPSVGSEMLGRFRLYRSGMTLTRHHHERIDGTGYPDAIAGEAIPFGARVITVADSYDAMTSDRPYRLALAHEEAIRRLVDGKGSQFDPSVVEAMVALSDRGEIVQIRNELMGIESAPIVISQIADPTNSGARDSTPNSASTQVETPFSKVV